MTSTKQIEANRRNARRSTGPRSESGQERAALNAVTHGLTAESPTLPTEDPVEYEEFRARLTRGLAPEGAIEEQFAEEVVRLSWRLRRADNLELGILAGAVASLDQRFFQNLQRKLEVTEGDVLRVKAGPSLDTVIEIVNEDAYDTLCWRIDETKDVLRSDEVRLGSAFVEEAAGSNGLSLLSRYEAGLFRRRDRALETLRELQAERQGSASKEVE